MPFVGYNGDGSVVEISHGEDGSLKLVEKASISGGMVSAASAGNDVLYYVSKSAPLSLCRWSFAKGKSEVVQDLVRPHGKVFFHRNKVFCIPLSDSGVDVYDPLCNAVEVLPIHYCIKWVEPADHGFVFRTVCDRTFGFDFTNGLTEVTGGSQITSFLGHYKRYAVVRVQDGSEERTAGVTEAGDIVALGVELPSTAFAECDGAVLHVDGTEILSSKGQRAAAPFAGLQLTASPASEEEVVCSICLCEFDGEDGVTLDCGHLFHKDCIAQWVSTWQDFAAKGEHVAFTHAVCASGCKCLIRHPLIPQSGRIAELFREVTMNKNALLPQFGATETDEDLLFYMCGKCGKAFYGGERVCSRMQGREPSSSPSDLICDTCLAGAHGGCTTFVPVFKCRYCCNPATQRSFGTRYLCERCNARWDTSEPSTIPCPGSDKCPFDGNHEEGKGGFIGCLLCSCVANADHIFDRVAAKKVDEGKADA
ncbi:RING-like zinc finger protein [Lotmaria passim]